MALGKKQKRFVEEYLVDLNAAAAARRAGYETISKTDLYYVYLLVNPLTEKIFYIGKGCKNRVNQHFNHFKSGTEKNPFKQKEMKTIVDSGEVPKTIIIKEFRDEDRAYKYERQLIKELKDTGITNISGGIWHKKETDRESAKNALSRLVPYHIWVKGISEEIRRQIKEVWGTPIGAYMSVKSGYLDIIKDAEFVQEVGSCE